MHVAPDATLESGLDLVAPRRVLPHRVPGLFRYVMSGRRLPRSVVSAHDVDRIEVRCDVPTALQADGEDLGDVTEAVFEAERGAVSVLA